MIHSLLIDFISEIIQASHQPSSILCAHTGWVCTQPDISAAMQAILNNPIGAHEAEPLLGTIFFMDNLVTECVTKNHLMIFHQVVPIGGPDGIRVRDA